MPTVVVIEGDLDVSVQCAELTAKIHMSNAYDAVKWIPRTQDAPGIDKIKSERAKVCLREAARHEFDFGMDETIRESTESNQLFMLSELYDAGGLFWRRPLEGNIKPDLIIYVDSSSSSGNSTSRRKSFVKFVRTLGFLDASKIKYIPYDDMVQVNMMAAILNIPFAPDAAAV